MGFRFRKSLNFGPFRINLSKSGIGWSVGKNGLRFTKKASGGYRASAGLPGTGLSYSKDLGGGKKKDGEKKKLGQTMLWKIVIGVLVVAAIAGWIVTNTSGCRAEKAEEASVAAAAEEKAQTGAAAGDTVYITDSGSKYHTEDCRYATDDAKAVTVAEAEKLGKEPCKTCH